MPRVLRFVNYYDTDYIDRMMGKVRPEYERIDLLTALSNSMAAHAQDLSGWWVMVPRKQERIAKLRELVTEVDEEIQKERDKLKKRK